VPPGEYENQIHWIAVIVWLRKDWGYVYSQQLFSLAKIRVDTGV